MLGYIAYGDYPKKPSVSRRQIAGGSFWELRLGRAVHPGAPPALRRAARGAQLLRSAGVRAAVFPLDLPYLRLFIRAGVLPVDALPLRRKLAAAMTKRRLEDLGLAPTEAVIAVAAERCTPEVSETVKALALDYRYVLLSARDGDEALAKSLRRTYGVSLLLRPAPAQLDRADALLLFVPRADLARENPVLYTLYPGGQAGRGRLELTPPRAVAEAAHANCDLEQLAAALAAQGVLRPEALLGEVRNSLLTDGDFSI